LINILFPLKLNRQFFLLLLVDIAIDLDLENLFLNLASVTNIKRQGILPAIRREFMEIRIKLLLLPWATPLCSAISDGMANDFESPAC